MESFGKSVLTKLELRSMLAVVALAYLSAFAYFSARLVWNCLRLSILRRSAVAFASPIEPASLWIDFDARLALHGVSIASSNLISGPVTMGVLHKLILVPPNIADLCQQQDVAAIVAHELAHIDRNDFLKNLVYEAVSLPAKYHPLLWPAREFMIETREIACDDLAA